MCLSNFIVSTSDLLLITRFDFIQVSHYLVWIFIRWISVIISFPMAVFWVIPVPKTTNPADLILDLSSKVLIKNGVNSVSLPWWCVCVWCFTSVSHVMCVSTVWAHLTLMQCLSKVLLLAQNSGIIRHVIVCVFSSFLSHCINSQ